MGNYLINLLFEATLSSVLHLSLIGGNLKERWSLFSHMPTHTHTQLHMVYTPTGVKALIPGFIPHVPNEL